MKSRRTANRRRAQRRGVAVIWVILLIPVILAFICLVVEIGNLWLARMDLENAVEAAALASVKTWGSGGANSTARTHGVQYARANTIVGQSISATQFTSNHNASNTNENADPANGNLIFGALSLAAPYTFSPNSPPQCGMMVTLGTAEINMAIETIPGMSHTYDELDAFSFHFVSDGGAGLSVTKLEFELQDNSTDDGVFDVDASNTSPSLPEPTTGTNRGMGPFLHSSTWSTLSTMTTFSPDGSTATQSSSLELTFPSGVFTATNSDTTDHEVVFGVDTDNVYTDTPAEQDSGGDFNQSGVDFRFSMTFTNGTDTVTVDLIGNTTEIQGAGNRTFTPPGLNKNIEVIIPPTGDYAVHAKATYPVQTLCEKMFGVAIGPFNVSAAATARYSCAGGPPQLVRITNPP